MERSFWEAVTAILSLFIFWNDYERCADASRKLHQVNKQKALEQMCCMPNAAEEGGNGN